MSRQQINTVIQQETLASTPTNPPAGALKLYPKSDGKFYYLTPAGLEKPMGAEDPLVVNNATINQVLTIGPTTSRITYLTGTEQHLSIAASAGNVALLARGTSTLSANAVKSGDGVWTQWDTAQRSSTMNLTTTSLNVYNAPATAGAPAFAQRLNLDFASGLLTVNGALTATGDVNAYYLQSSDGSNGIVRSGVGGMYVRAANTHVYMDGAGGLHVTVGPLDVAAGLSLTNGKLDLYKASTTTGYNATNVEVRAPTPNQPGIGFHESGSTATTLYKRAGTEELWQRYNSGTVDARLLHNGEVGTGGSQIVRRDTNGYIFGSYINMTADVQPGAPVYVAGQQGDNYMRWYPRGNLVPGWTTVAAQARSSKNKAWVRAATTWVNRTGYWIVVARSDSRDASLGGNSRCGVMVVINGNSGGTCEWGANLYGGFFSGWPLEVHWVGVMTNGQEVGVNVYNTNWDGNEDRDSVARVDAYFASTSGYIGS